MKLSVIICTYNRANILADCIESFFFQTASRNLYEVLIIDNNSVDNTRAVAREFTSKYSFCTYHFEPTQGLSHARNTGYKVARHDWVAYIDDDARAFPDFVERALWDIKNFDFDAFGGLAVPLYLTPKPRWLPEKLEIFDIEGIHEPCELESQYFHGYAMVFRKKVLERMNGFPVNLGMTGSKVAYGEETMLQFLMKRSGSKLGYDPGLRVFHAVGKQKYELAWHIRSAYAHGRDSKGINYDSFVFKELILVLIHTLFIGWPKAAGKLFLRKRYYWQNMFLEMIQPIAVALGKYHASRKKLPKEH